jgi:hypothetical protein
MFMMNRCRWVLGFVLAVSVSSACQVAKSSNPLSPSIAGPIAGVEITTPNLLEPGQDWRIWMRDQPVRLMIQNADTSGQRPVTYAFEIASDEAFNSIIFKRTGVTPGNVITTLQLPDTLPTGRTYWWRARAEDGANVGPYSKVVSFVAVTPVVLSPPLPVSPSGTITTTVPEFKLNAGGKSGPTERVVYSVQVANDQAFSSIAATFLVDEAGAQTIIAQNYGFLNNRTYYWRTQATDVGDSRAVSTWSNVQIFNTAQAAPPPGPGPDPGPGGGGGGDASKCGPPFQTTPLGILQCHRDLYPAHMGSGQAVAFLKASARDLNRAAVSGGPFGILHKATGNQCLGYSCDIICAGQGSGQRQYDVLIDEKYANWGTPISGPGIRVDFCEIQ